VGQQTRQRRQDQLARSRRSLVHVFTPTAPFHAATEVAVMVRKPVAGDGRTATACCMPDVGDVQPSLVENTVYPERIRSCIPCCDPGGEGPDVNIQGCLHAT
jgi:hypothetical protein